MSQFDYVICNRENYTFGKSDTDTYGTMTRHGQPTSDVKSKQQPFLLTTEIIIKVLRSNMVIMTLKAQVVCILALLNTCNAFSGPKPQIRTSSCTSLNSKPSSNSYTATSSRREWIQTTIAATGALAIGESLTGFSAPARAVTGFADGNLPDLPPDAGRSYLQYRVPLQIAADYYVFELNDQLGNIDEWGNVNQLFQTNNNKGQGQPNKIERDYTNPMRILGTFIVCLIYEIGYFLFGRKTKVIWQTIYFLNILVNLRKL